MLNKNEVHLCREKGCKRCAEQIAILTGWHPNDLTPEVVERYKLKLIMGGLGYEYEN